MKTLLCLSLLLIHLVFSSSSYSQSNKLNSSNTLAYKCARHYIESFNHINIENLSEFFSIYYKNQDLDRKLKIEQTLKESWGKLEINRIVYDTENEVILLVYASKIPNSYLLFDLKLDRSPSHKIEYFTRTGIPKPKGQTAILTNNEAMNFADRSIPIDDSLAHRTVTHIAKAFNKEYYDPIIGKSIYEKLINELCKGNYYGIKKVGKLADKIKSDILHVNFDSHTSVDADRNLLNSASNADSIQDYGFEIVKIINGKIGYIKLNEFNQSNNAQIVASRALDSISNCSSLILDLRHNFGGFPEMIQFISSYFFTNPVKINTLFDRNGNIVNEIWTLESIPAKPFPNSFPVIILTSKQTSSAAEGFVYLFKKTKRAIIIGEQTSGAHHPAKEVIINPFFVVSIPFLRGDEITLKEGTGIAPDIMVKPETALEKAIDYLIKLESNF